MADVRIKNTDFVTNNKDNPDLYSIAFSINYKYHTSNCYPELILEMKNQNTVIHRFNSGKNIVSRIELEDKSTAIDKMTNKFSSLEML